MAKIIAVGNLKGGVGKTTLAVNVACELVNVRSVHLIDADPQASAKQWHDQGKLSCPINFFPAPEGRPIKQWIDQIRTIDKDLVFIDLPPQFGPTFDAAIRIADLFVIPVTPSMLDGRATATALAPITALRAQRAKKSPACLLVPNRVDRRTTAGLQIEAALLQFGEPVAPAVGARSAFVEAATAGCTVGAYAPRSSAHFEIVVLATVIDTLAAGTVPPPAKEPRGGHTPLKFFPRHSW